MGQVRHRYELNETSFSEKDGRERLSMGDGILKGISAALFVTVITLFAGLLWTATGFEGLSTSTLVDMGLVASCIAAGYQGGKESGQWILGGVSSLSYVLLCVVLMALFLELRAWGVIQVLAEGGLIGILAGAFGAGSGGRRSRGSGWRAPRYFSWGEGSDSSSAYSSSYSSRGHKDWDEHMDNWDELLNEDRDKPYEKQTKKGRKGWREGLWCEEDRTEEDGLWKEDLQWQKGATSVKRRGLDRYDKEANADEEEWENWLEGEKDKSESNYRKAWWEEDVL